MKVNIIKLRENAKIPTKSYDGDFCYDVYACDCIEVAPNVYKYPLGIALQIDRGDNTISTGEIIESVYIQDPETGYPVETSVANGNKLPISKLILSIDARPRSSVFKTGMVLCNCCGTIDEGYTNEISAFFYHVMPTMPKYEAGDRVCQIKIGFTVPVEFNEVKEFKNNTGRGLNGFGSSGLK